MAFKELLVFVVKRIEDVSCASSENSLNEIRCDKNKNTEWRRKDSMGRLFNAVYFRRGLTCTLGLTNDLIDGGQPRAKPYLRKAKPNHVLRTVCSPWLATVYQEYVRPRLKY